MHTLEEIRNEYNRLDEITGVDTSSIPIVKSKSVHQYGYCRIMPINTAQGIKYTPTKIAISAFVFSDEREFLDTIRHEYAHACASLLDGERHGHDVVWKRICKQVGCRPTSCVPTDSQTHQNAVREKSKYTVVCDKCNTRWYFARKTKLICKLETGTAHSFMHKQCGSHSFHLE